MKKTHGWVLLFALIIDVFAHSIPNGFIWDDHEMVENNPYVSSIEHLPEILSKPLSHVTAHPDNGFLVYRPLQLVSYLIEHLLGAKSALVFHLTNLLLHLAIVTTLYFFLLSQFSPLPAFLLTALFGVHPAVSSIVYNITARHDSLLTLFFLLTLLSLFAKNSRFIFLSVVTYTLALFSKETAVILSPALFVAFAQSPHFKDRKYVWPVCIFVLILIYEMIARRVGVRFSVSAFFLSPFTKEWWMTLAQNIANILLPFSPMGYREVPTSISVRFWISVVLLLFLLGWAIFHQKNKTFFWIGLLTAFPPLLLLTTVGLMTGVPQDHYLVIPTLGLVLIFASVLPAQSWPRSWFWILAAVIACFSTFSFIASYQWKNEKTFWEFAYQMNGGTPQIHRSLWPIYEEEGDREKVQFHCEEALELTSPSGRHRQIYLDSLQCLGALHYRSGNIEKSFEFFEKLRTLKSSK